jgi:hypothetical protein
MSDLSLVKIGTLSDDECPKRPSGCKIPVVIRPSKDTSHKFLVNWVSENKVWITKQFYEHGAVLFRGFDVEKPQDFEDIIVQLSPNLGNEYFGTSPRTMLTKYTFTSTELPSIFPIPQHRTLDLSHF